MSNGGNEEKPETLDFLKNFVQEEPFKGDFEDFKRDLNSSKKLKIISFWKPRNNFHFGQYFCLAVLAKLSEEYNATVTIILGQDPERYINPKDVPLYTSLTKEFINKMAPGQSSPKIIVKESEDLKRKIKPESLDPLKTKWKNLPKEKRESFEQGSWFNYGDFALDVAAILMEELEESSFLLSGWKHKDLWKTIQGVFFNDQTSEGKKLKLIFIQDFKDLKDRSPLSSKTTPPVDLLELDETEKNKLYSKLMRLIGNANVENGAFDSLLRLFALTDKAIYFQLRGCKEKLNSSDNVEREVAREQIKEIIFSNLPGVLDTWQRWKNKFLQVETNFAVNNKCLIESVIGRGLANSEILQKNQKDSFPTSDATTELLEDINEKPEEHRSIFQKLIINCLKKISEHAQIPVESRAKLDQIEQLVGKTRSIDQTLYIFEKWHRDHFLHQFNVAAFGDFLLNVYVNENKRLINEISENTELSPGEIRLSWWIAALLHDHGYPFEMLFKITPFWKKVEEITYGQGRNDSSCGGPFPFALVKDLVTPFCSYGLTCFVDKFCTSPDEETRKEIERKLIFLGNELFKALDLNHLSFSHLDHGHLGALNAANYLDFWKKGADPTKIDVTSFNESINLKSIDSKWIKLFLKAIALHEKRNRSGEEKVSLNKDPILFLLILCDELQEWCRRQFTQERTADLHLEHSIENVTISLKEIRGTGYYEFPEVLEINFNCRSDPVLEKLGWQRKIFAQDKIEQLKRLDFNSNRPEDFKPKGIKFSITIPQEL